MQKYIKTEIKKKKSYSNNTIPLVSDWEIIDNHAELPMGLDNELVELDNVRRLCTEDKLELRKNINTQLKMPEYMKIYYILCSNEDKTKYSKNSNGVWFDFNVLQLYTQMEIYNYVNMCIINNKKYNILKN